MPQHGCAEGERDIEPLRAVDVPEARAGGAVHDDGIDDLFPGLLETGDRARVGEVCAVLLRVAFRAAGAGGIGGDEAVEPALLRCVESGGEGGLKRAEWAVSGGGRPGRRGKGAGVRWRRNQGRSRLRGLPAGEMRGQGFQGAGVLEQLAEGDFDAELARDGQRGLREKERVEAEIEEARGGGNAGQVEAGKIGQQMLEIGERGVVSAGGQRGRNRWCRGRPFLDGRSRRDRRRRVAGNALRRRLAIRGGGRERHGRAGREVGEIALALEGIAGE